MKKIIFFLCLITSCNCSSQVKNGKIKNNKMTKTNIEYFNIEKYKDWETDDDWSSNESTKFLKKGNDKVEIYFYNEGIQVRIKSIKNPYEIVKGFSNYNKRLLGLTNNFYQFPIGIDKEYDENGIVVKEIDNDTPYVFSLNELLQKIKKEYNVDLEDLTQRASVTRRVDPYLNKPIYEVHLRKSIEDIETNRYFYILIDATTGNVLYTTSSYYKKGDDGSLSPFEEYYSALKKKETENNAYYKTYKGKDYTKKEWEAFEEEWYEDYKKNKNKGFWDDIFKRSGKK